MTQPRHPASPLTARLYDLEYPRSLGVYSTYQEVQAVVDTLADNHFPVQSTLIVGTDLKLMERVTGRKSWGRVIGQGALSGLWMGLFLGLLLMLIAPSNFMVVLTSVLLGIVFFTVWAVIGYAMSGGKRDFTSMTSTIPMQYELLVEHKHADEARRLLVETGAAPAVTPHSPSTQLPGHGAPSGYPGPSQPGSSQPGSSQPGFSQSGPSQPNSSYGTPPTHGGNSVPQYGSAPVASPPSSERPDSQRPSRPTYGKPIDSAPQPTASDASSRTGRPAFGRPAGTALYEGSPAAAEPQRPVAEQAHGSQAYGSQPSGSPSAADHDRPGFGYSYPERPKQPEQSRDDQNSEGESR
ncbi:general stress protein [Brachybacterium tyrofermentans]|uniref:general stress protein n=1 Tax=Brachybacterium tyrofermentans TaxID=47848 RepID=UPI000A1AE90C|nr:PROBABLE TRANSMEMBRANE PROTEIN [Corynebacterium xerosis]